MTYQITYCKKSPALFIPAGVSNFMTWIWIWCVSVYLLYFWICKTLLYVLVFSYTNCDQLLTSTKLDGKNTPMSERDPENENGMKNTRNKTKLILFCVCVCLILMRKEMQKRCLLHVLSCEKRKREKNLRTYEKNTQGISSRTTCRARQANKELFTHINKSIRCIENVGSFKHFSMYWNLNRQGANQRKEKIEKDKVREKPAIPKQIEKKQPNGLTETRIHIRVSCQINWYGFCLVPFCMRYPVCVSSFFHSLYLSLALFLNLLIFFHLLYLSVIFTLVVVFQSAAAFLFIIIKKYLQTHTFRIKKSESWRDKRKKTKNVWSPPLLAPAIQTQCIQQRDIALATLCFKMKIIFKFYTILFYAHHMVLLKIQLFDVHLIIFNDTSLGKCEMSWLFFIVSD